MLIGPESDDGQHRWYFSLNNRRLWVLKRCREEGLLQATKNQILVRVREPKSQSEKERYTIQNCVVEAKVMPDKRKKDKPLEEEDSKILGSHVNNTATIAAAQKEAAYEMADQKEDDNNDDDSTDESIHDCNGKDVERNRFNAQF